eukprot:CAMPEP_0184484712 /NCGR_PEP_ID=MMETSP0113_2-20130426/6394_1 /TAXON_ID=91329 /ORGANISM="Norrisiella sphaerica, Strain BC52" /LENGTH=41 /DNA_ID= /DNA_START= /DNA_END= /DNA_ORIENTATION=
MVPARPGESVSNGVPAGTARIANCGHAEAQFLLGFGSQDDL